MGNSLIATEAKTSAYDVKIKQYKSGEMEMVKYSKPIYRNLIEPEEKPLVKPKGKKSKEGLIRDDNLSRSFKILIDLAIENSREWKSFLTLTFKENVNDIDKANLEFKKGIRKLTASYPGLKYLCVPEFQKRGAVHYHLLVNVPVGHESLPVREEKTLYNLKTNRTTKINSYDFPWWPHGYSSAFDLTTTDEKFSVAAYMTKYFWKDIDNRLFGRRKVMYSKNLEKPKEVHISENSQEMANYLEYINRYMTKTNEKHILSETPYVPNMSVYKFETTELYNERKKHANETRIDTIYNPTP